MAICNYQWIYKLLYMESVSPINLRRPLCSLDLFRFAVTFRPSCTIRNLSFCVRQDISNISSTSEKDQFDLPLDRKRASLCISGKEISENAKYSGWSFRPCIPSLPHISCYRWCFQRATTE